MRTWQSQMRKIVVDGVEYSWKLGRSNVVIRCPSGKRVAVSISDLPNVPYDFERARWKRYLHITPVNIAGYIRANIGSVTGGGKQ